MKQVDSKELKIFQKILMDHSFTKDDIEYHFLSIELDEGGWAYNIVVNVVLPVKRQSYATPVFSNHIHDILSNIWKYVGSSFSYSETILVDGKEPTNPVFISPEKQKEIISTIRKKVRSATIRTGLGRLGFNINWKPVPEFYSLDDVYIDFVFDIELFHFVLDGTNVEPNLKIADDVSSAIRELLLDDDYFRESVNNIIYEVMGDEIDITNVDDLYYQVVYYVTKIDGFDVSKKWGDHYDLEPDMFT